MTDTNVIDFDKAKDERKPATGVDRMNAARLARIAAGDTKAKGGRPSKADRDVAAARRLANMLGVEDLEELVDLFHREGKDAFLPLRPAALKALAADLTGNDPKNRRDAYQRVLDMTDGKPKPAADEDDGPKRIEFHTVALEGVPPPAKQAFSFD